MKIAIGSTNPAKVAAVRRTVAGVWPAAELVTLQVPSGVSVMPSGDAEIIAGARNRARAARAAAAADLGVGLEGGVNHEPWGLMLVGWVAVVDAAGREGLGATARLPLPPPIAERVAAGRELGPLMDELLGEEDVRAKGGAVGALTAGLVPREHTFAMALAFALAPFLVPYFYEQQ